ncbi:MAG: TIGR01777 family oxidoreductase [Cryomorphaceae bacterium]|nr:TIGR01777 family oxidoreductase [Cryomorphaceae bacterium]
MKTVLITGGTGLVGQAVTERLQKEGLNVRILSTNKSLADNNDHVFHWNPEKLSIDEHALADVDAIINLAGSSINQPWTKSGKEQIVNSRINSCKTLSKALNGKTINCIVAASAVGIYPDKGDQWIDESTTADRGFLAETVVKWEQASAELEKYCDRLITLRIGVVLSDLDGALPVIAKPVKLGIGSGIGSGKQYMSWIHINDLAKMMWFGLTNENVKGVYNAVASMPVTNNDFTKSLANTLNKPYFFPNVPAFVMRLLLGERADIVLKGSRVSNNKIQKHNFQFDYDHVDQAFKSFNL